MEPEFLDPGPDQPEPTPYGAAPSTTPPFGSGPPAATAPPWAPPWAPPPAPRGRREVIGLVIMLCAAALLPLVASAQSLFAVRERTIAGFDDYALDAWGQFSGVAGPQLYAHGPRFGVALIATGVGFAVLLLGAGVVLLGGRSTRPQRVSGLLAGAATGLVGLLVGTVLAMALEIQSAFDTLRSTAATGATPVLEVRLRVGGAVFIAIAGVLAGGLAVSAALRVRRTAEGPSAGPPVGWAPGAADGPVNPPPPGPTPGEAATWR